MFNNKRKNKKKLLVVALMGGVTYAQAEVLVILPESGPMARVASSIKLGFQSAYEASDEKEPIKFVNSEQNSMAQLLKKHITKKTKMIIGPLSRNDVDALIKAKPKMRVLALNEGSTQVTNISQFSLAKKHDASALKNLLEKDQMKEIYAIRQAGAENEHELFLMALMTQISIPLHVLEECPQKIKKYQALLLLGGNEWMNSQSKLPKKQIYALSNAIEQDLPIPQGLKFCDTPALYSSGWTDMYAAYERNPSTMSYQRLMAFGGDAWTITQMYLHNPKLQEASFEGRTGLIHIQENIIQRTPHCFKNTRHGVVIL